MNAAADITAEGATEVIYHDQSGDAERITYRVGTGIADAANEGRSFALHIAQRSDSDYQHADIRVITYAEARGLGDEEPDFKRGFGVAHIEVRRSRDWESKEWGEIEISHWSGGSTSEDESRVLLQAFSYALEIRRALEAENWD